MEKCVTCGIETDLRFISLPMCYDCTERTLKRNLLYNEPLSRTVSISMLPKDTQLSGGVNFSRIDMSKIEIRFEPSGSIHFSRIDTTPI